MKDRLEDVMSQNTTVIYHNPDSGTPRNTLAMIRNAGIEPVVIEYLKQPPSKQQAAQMIAAAGLTVRQAFGQSL
jgi:arsenate reductase